MPDLSSVLASKEVQQEWNHGAAQVERKLLALLKAEGLTPLSPMDRTAVHDLATSAVGWRIERRLLAGIAKAVA